MPDGSDRANLEEAVAASATAAPDGCELLFSAFSASLGHYRKANVCIPFPRDLFNHAERDDKDFDAAIKALESVPRISQLARTEELQKLPTEALQLAKWLLVDRWAAKGRRIRAASLSEVQAVCQKGGSTVCPNHSAAYNFMPSLVLALEQPANDAWHSTNSIYAFHGTSLENLHSILHAGLVVLSGTALERTGALHGSGIYCSTVAFSFCKPGNVGPWPGCQLGRKVRALLVCEVDREAAVTNEHGLPEKYIIIKGAGQVRVRYVMLYMDDMPPLPPPCAHKQQPRMLDHGTMLILIYGLLLMCIGMSYNMDTLVWFENLLRSWRQ